MHSAARRTIDPLRWSKSFQRSINTAIPIVTTVRIPLTFEPQVQAMNVPVAKSQPHHSGVNSLQNHQRKSQEGRSQHSPITQLLEPDICINSQRHEEDQSRVQQNKTRLRNVCIVYSRKNQRLSNSKDR